MNPKLLILVVAACIGSVVCGPSTTLKIINQTPHDLIKTGSGAHEMVKWNFPDTIKAGDSTGPMTVEFSDSTSASAFADFESPGTDQKLTVGSQHNYPPPNGNNPNLWVNWFGHHVDVGFMPNGFITLTLKRPPTNRIAKMNGLNGIEISKSQ